MNGRATSVVVVGFGICVGLATGVPAHGAEQPLLIAVEAPPGADVDAADIRRAIGAELQKPTVAPTELSSGDSEDAVIVAVDDRHITVSLREGKAEPVGRTIAAPADRASRVRAIAWLAGNLARDQVTGIVEAPAPPTPTPPATAIEPPVFEAPAATVAVSGQPSARQQSGWTIAVAAGPSFSSYEIGHVLRQSSFGLSNFRNAASDISRTSGMAWRIEARHQEADSKFFRGLALEGCSNDFLDEIVGAMATAGTARRRGNWSFEARVGAGVDLGERPLQPSTFRASDGTIVMDLKPEVRLGVFADGSVAVAHTLSRSVDLVLTLAIHQSVLDEYDGYVGTMLGARYRP